MGWDLALPAFFLEDLQHLNKLAEDEDLLSFVQQRLQEFEQCFSLAGRRIVADEVRVAANLAQTREGREDVHFTFGDALFGHSLHDPLAAATQFGQVKFTLRFTEFAIAPLLDAVGQILRDLPFKPSQHERAKSRGQTAARDFLSPGRVFAATRFVSLGEMVLRTEVTRLNEVHDTPKVEQTVFQRRAGQCEALVRAKLFH